MAPEQILFEQNHIYAEPLDQWETISSTRPPVFNADNCSCEEASRYAKGGYQPSQSLLFEQQTHTHEITAYDSPGPYETATTHYNEPPYYQSPQSATSSAPSITCPEGPEFNNPNIPITDTYLPLIPPEPGLNEIAHRRTASFHSELSYPMRRFLVDDSPATYSSQTETARSGEINPLPQGNHIISSRARKQPKGSALSYQSWSEDSTGEMSLSSWGSGDLMTAVGAQFVLDGDGGSNGWEGGYPMTREGGYPMTMSGVSGLSGN